MKLNYPNCEPILLSTEDSTTYRIASKGIISLLSSVDGNTSSVYEIELPKL